MRLVIATGGTGGHLFPALKVAGEIKGQGHEVILMGSFTRGRAHVEQSGFPFEELGAKGFAGVPVGRKLAAFGAMAGALWRSLRALRRLRPDAVAGFGGYGAFPVVLAAALLRIPTLIHEQNVVPGRANAWLAKSVGKVAITFERSRRYFAPSKTVHTGCPCHAPDTGPVDRAAARAAFGLQAHRSTILVFGGSQGSHRINEVFIDSVTVLQEKMPLQVVHICGHSDYAALKSRYDESGIPFALFEFLDKMKEAYLAADLVISRAGAVTVSEIAAFRLPSILIPYPHALGHQKDNASVLCITGSARMIEENALSSTALTENVLAMLEAKRPVDIPEDLYVADAARRIAEEIMCLGKKA